MTVVRPALIRFGAELRMAFADSQVRIVLGFLVVLVVGQAALPSEPLPGTDLDSSAFQVGGLPALAALVSGLVMLPQTVSRQRQDGTVDRVRAWPRGLPAYLLARTLTGLALGGLAALTMLVTALATGLAEVPDSAEDWLTLAWALPLGILAVNAIGLLLGALLDEPMKGGNSVVYTVAMAGLMLTGSAFGPTDRGNTVMATLSDINPITYLGRAVRSAILPESFAAAEPGGTWGLTTCAAWLVGLGIVFLALGLLALRMRGRPRGSAVALGPEEPTPS
jgi:ABC-2 type transport system permease protein